MKKRVSISIALAAVAIAGSAAANLYGSYVLPADSDATLYERSNGRLGLQVVSGDFDGDGRLDVAASSPVGAGKVYVVLGHVAGGGKQIDVTKADIVFSGASGSEAGWSLGVGDLLGDANDDLVVGAPSASNGRGQVYVFQGPIPAHTALTPANATATFTGTVNNGYAGWSVTTGDFDGDGKDELAIGACGTQLATGTGSAYLVSKVLSGAKALNDPSISLFSGRGLTGCSMAATDFNGDGYDELILGSYGSPAYNNASWGGDVHIFYGRKTWAARYELNHDLANPDTLDAAVLYGVWEGGNFGYALGTEDVNDDGYGDLLIGQPEVECHQCLTPPRNGGFVFVVLGAGENPHNPRGRPLVGVSAADNTAYLTLQGESSDDQAGISVSGAGDTAAGVTGREFMVGSAVGKSYLHQWLLGVIVPELRYNCVGDPEASVCDGPYFDYDRQPTQFLNSVASARAIFEDSRPNTFAGRTVAGVGDVSGDGLSDVAIGAPHQLQYDGDNYGPGEVHLFYGK